MEIYAIIFALVTMMGINAQIIQRQLGLWTPQPFAIDARVNGVATKQIGIKAKCTSDVQQGTFSIDDIVTTAYCPGPYVRYNLPLIGRVPTSRLIVIRDACTPSDTLQFNLSRQYDANVAAQQDRKLLNIFDTIKRVVNNVFGNNGCDDCATKADVENLQNQTNVLSDKVKQVDLSLQGTIDIMQSYIGNTTTVLTNQNIINKGFQLQIDAAKANQNHTDFEIRDLRASIASITSDVDAQFAASKSAMKNEQDQIAQQFTSSAADLQALAARVTNVYSTEIDLANQTSLRFTDVYFLLNQANDNFNVFLNAYWNEVNNRYPRRTLTKGYFEDLAAMPPGYKAMTSGGLPPLAEYSIKDSRIVFEASVLNYVDTQTGGSGPFARLVSNTITYYASTDFAIDNTPPYQTIQSMLRNIGPTGCARPFAGFDSHNNPIAESIQYANGIPCRYWVESVQTTCTANVPSFAWRTQDPFSSPSGQPAALRSIDCKSGSTPVTTVTVMRSFIEMQAYFASVPCAANLWPASGSEYQLYMPLSNQIGYIPGDSQSTLCALPYQLQGTSVKRSLFLTFVQALSFAYPMFYANVLGAELKRDGRFPQGLDFDVRPLTYTPVRRDDQGNLIIDGGASARCWRSSWVMVSDITEPVYAAVPATDVPVFHEVLVSTMVPAPNVTLDYAITDVQTDVTYSSDFTHLTPQTFIMFGDPTSADPKIYDVPDTLATISPDQHARTASSSVVCDLGPVDDPSSQTFDELRLTYGPLWDPVSCWMQISSFQVDKGFDDQLAPFCAIAAAVPAGYNATDVSPNGNGRIANGKLCTTLQAFRMAKVFRNNAWELQLSPRIWTMEFTLLTQSGKFVNIIDSVCPDAVMVAVNTTFVRLTLSNLMTTANSIVVTTSTSSHTEVEACNSQRTVQSPPTPAQKTIDLPACVDMTVIIQRVAVDPVTSLLTLVQCGAPITYSAIQAAIQNFVGLDPAVSYAILNSSIELTTQLSGVSSTAFAISSGIDIALLKLVGGSTELIASLQTGRALVPQNLSQPFIFASGSLPPDSNIAANTEKYLREIDALLASNVLVNQTQLDAVKAAINENVDIVTNIQSQNFPAQLAAIKFVLANISFFPNKLPPSSVHFTSNSIFGALGDLAVAWADAEGNGISFLAGAAESGGKELLAGAKAIVNFAADTITQVAGLPNGILGAIGSIFGSMTFWLSFIVALVILGAIAVPIMKYFWNKMKADMQKAIEEFKAELAAEARDMQGDVPMTRLRPRSKTSVRGVAGQYLRPGPTYASVPTTNAEGNDDGNTSH